jgi:tRNA(His) 5'-end guanylyltransferase
MPAIIRLDGKTFHTLTRKCHKPFDEHFIGAMSETALHLCSKIQGAKCAYTQSDEISVLLTDYDRLDTQGWFDYNVQKMVSISAAIASIHFSHLWGSTAIFDSRAFNIPKEEITNYFVWRQKDWIRNSVQMLARAHFSAKQLLNKKQEDMHEMLHGKGINWIDLPEHLKNGWLISKNDQGVWDHSSPILTKQREIIEQMLIPMGE